MDLVRKTILVTAVVVGILGTLGVVSFGIWNANRENQQITERTRMFEIHAGMDPKVANFRARLVQDTLDKTGIDLTDTFIRVFNFAATPDDIAALKAAGFDK